MPDQYTRTRAQLGTPALDVLRRAHVAVFGIGGVGGKCRRRVGPGNQARRAGRRIIRIGFHGFDLAACRDHRIGGLARPNNGC